ncbi:MAG: TVP38/TMEM64 family protein [Oligoflexus sp.]
MRKKMKTMLLRFLPVVVGGAIIIIFLSIWRHSPIQEYAEQEKLQNLLLNMRDQGWTPFLVYPTYIIAHFFLFPNMVLNAAVIITFGGFIGWLLAITGSLCSASVFFFLGHKFGGSKLQHYQTGRIVKLRKLLRKGGVGAVLSVRLVPIAPYPVVNSAAGAIHLRYFDFIAGTFLAHLPGTVTLAFFGEQLEAVLRDPSPKNLLILASIVMIGILIIWSIKRIAEIKMEKESSKK